MSENVGGPRGKARDRVAPGGTAPRSPVIRNRFGAALLRRAAAVTRALTRDWRPAVPPGREERFARLVRSRLASSILMVEAERAGGVQIDVATRTAFGKPPLVSVDISVTQSQEKLVEERLFVSADQSFEAEEERRASYHLFLVDLLERAVQAVWDNPELAPVAVRGRIVFTGEPPEREVRSVRLEMTDLGYEDETARPEDLFSRLGAPASDPAWRP